MKKKPVIFVLIILLLPAFLFSESYYDTGSQVFQISAGVDLPLSNSYRNEDGSWNSSFLWGDENTHFNIGGYGSIDYEVFVSRLFSVGGEIGYQFNRCTDQQLFTIVPFLAKASWVPVQGKFELPLSLGLGFAYLSYNDKSMFSLSSSLCVGVRYFITEHWAIGIKGGISFTPELYFRTEKNGLHSSVPALLFATYRN